MSALFAFLCRDGADAACLRQQHLAAHLAHVEAHMGAYAVAGPLKDGEETVGSLLIIRASDHNAARRKLESDPYFVAGVWERIERWQFMAVAGEWVGGAAWKRPSQRQA